jgi:GNAT superfamily N-acetyltransferase
MDKGLNQTTTPVISRQATDHDLQSMLDTLVPAFANDPVWGDWAFPDRSRATVQRRAIFDFWLQGALPYRAIRVTERCEAVAAWYAPEGTATSESEQLELVARARALLGSHAEVFLRGCELLETAHPQNRPHYYLSLLGTHDDHRGNGLGMSLLRENLAMLDAAGMPAYLESTNPKNLTRYERLGFRRIGALDFPVTGPRVDLMWREPAMSAAC